MIFVFGQWQGGGDRETLEAALAVAGHIKRSYVSAYVEEDSRLDIINGIRGFDIIREQTSQALSQLRENAPDHFLTVGGGCDADVASISYMNEKYNGGLTVVWLDAHGDLNAPEESVSHLFFGMPLRALLGDCPHVKDLIPVPLQQDHVIHIGGRDFDPSEQKYLENSQIGVYPVIADRNIDQEDIFRRIGENRDKPIYIHFDMDVLDPKEFDQTPLPVDRGISFSAAKELLYGLKKRYNVVGMGIFEFSKEAVNNNVLRSLLEFGMSL